MATLRLRLKPQERTVESTNAASKLQLQSKCSVDRVEGIIVWFRNEFGFVRRENTAGNDYFAHKNEFEEGYIPKPNDRVNFLPVAKPKKLLATKISRSKNETPKFSSKDFL